MLKKGLSQNDAFAAVGDLVFMRFISPAIVYPVRPKEEGSGLTTPSLIPRHPVPNYVQEPYGIVTDTPVSPQARRNLTLVSARRVCL